MAFGRKERMKQRRNPVAAALSILGILMLVVLVLVCLPLTVPRLFGYHIFSVVSGSMEPAIPTGSLVYIKEAAPEDMAEGDVIAFYGFAGSAAIVTHRVVENRVVMGEFITKGDANQTQDMNPVLYASFIGKVVSSIPEAGRIAGMFTSLEGKIMAGSLVGAAVFLQLLASLIDSITKRGS